MKMFKRILAVVCTLAVAATITSSFTISNAIARTEGIYQTGEKTFVYEDLFYEVLNDGTLMLRGPLDLVYNVKEKKLVIPAEVNGKKVSQIREYAFNGIGGLEYLDIPNSVTRIGESAFGLCKDLKSVKIGNALKSIGPCAFESTSIETLTLPDSVINIGWGAFANCVNLKSVTIPSGIKTISSRLFMGCTGLEKVTIPDSVTEIKNYAFSDCTGLLSISLPHNIKTINDNTFYNCSNLESVFISNSIKEIEKCAFSRCYKLNDVYYSGTKEQWDEISISYSNEELKKATIHYNSDGSDILENETKTLSGKCGDNLIWMLDDKGVLTISGTGEMYDYSYMDPTPWDSDNVVSATIENGVTSIGNYAFGKNCKSVFIPKSLKRIGEYAFGMSGYSYTESGYAYTDIYYLGSEDEWNKISKPERDDMTLLLSICHFNYNPTHQQEDEKISGTCGAHLSWTRDENGTLTISGTGEMYYFSGLETIAPWWVLDSLFNKSLPVNAVVIEDGVSSIGANAFSGCKDIKSILLSDSVETIEGGAFVGCTGLTTISIPKGIAKIEGASGRSGDSWGTFAKCSSLTEFKVDSDNQSYKSVSGVLFTKDGTKLVAYPAGKQDRKYSIPGSVTNIGECAFDKCENLTNIIIPDSVTDIGGCAFQSCTNLETIIIHEGITSLNWFAFRECSNLKKLYIPKNVTTIGDEWAPAFDGCNGLSDVYYSGNKEDWVKIKITDNITEEVINSATIHYNCDPDEASETETENIIQIDFKGQSIDIKWSDDLFSHSTYEYDNNLAITALALSGSAESETPDEVKTVLRKMNFDEESMVCNKYGESNPMQPAHVFATKEITVNCKPKTLVCVTVRGSISKEDWTITDPVDGVKLGFSKSASYLLDELVGYLVEYANFTQDRKEDFIFLITGHSLGGAVASYLTELCISHNLVLQDNVFAYTFAAPRYFTDISKQYKNLFEVINQWDIVPNLGYPGNFLGIGHDGVFVQFTPYDNENFANTLSKWFPDKKLNVFNKKYNHLSETYMAQLLSNPPSVGLKKIFRKSYFVSVRCPVNVEIYDSDNKLLARVVNNTVDESITDSCVSCVIEGDKKYFFIETDKEIEIKLTGTDTGTMEYSVQTLHSVDEAVSEDDFITYEKVHLEPNKTFYSKLSSNDNSAKAELYVVDPKTNEPLKSVGLDGKETNLTKENYIWMYIGGAVLIVAVIVAVIVIYQKRRKKH